MPRRSRAETVTAPASSERPSTSGGLTSSNHLEKPDFNKRVSRDDLALILKKSDHNNVRAYHVPIRGRLPSPDHSLRGSSPHRGIMVRTATPDSMPDKTETGVIAIGMALGSPSQCFSSDSAQAAWTVQRAMAATAEEEAQQGQQKTKKWGIFRSKSRRNKQADSNPTQRSMTDNSNISSSSLHGRGQPPGAFSRTPSQKHTPIVIRSQTDPSSERIELREPMPEMRPTKETKPSKEAKSGGLGRKVSLRALRGDRSRRAAEKELPIPAMPSPPPPPMIPQIEGPLLDVEIPSIKMERYSVMFGGVLGGQSSSSLLARRQATLDRLKTINDDGSADIEELGRPRRITSPQPTASPSFNLFPKINHGGQPSPRIRSNTSPAMLPSPVQATFQQNAMASREKLDSETLQPLVFQPAPLRIVKKNGGAESATDSPKLKSKFTKPPKRAVAAQVENVNKLENLKRHNTRTPSPARSLDLRSNPPKRGPSPFTPETSSLLLDSDDEDDEVDAHITEKLRPTIDEPKWEMISPPVSTTSSSPGRARKLSLTSSEKITLSKTKKPSYDEEALRAAVEISIARQISVSHQQRQMLHPLKSNPSIRHRKEGGPQYAIAIEKDERLAETRTATPRLVRPEEISKWEMHRKSSRVVLEGEP